MSIKVEMARKILSIPDINPSTVDSLVSEIINLVLAELLTPKEMGDIFYKHFSGQISRKYCYEGAKEAIAEIRRRLNE